MTTTRLIYISILGIFFLTGCMGLPYSVEIKAPVIQKKPFQSGLSVSYTRGGDTEYWITHYGYNHDGYCGMLWTTLTIKNNSPFVDALDHLLPQYYIKHEKLWRKDADITLTDHHLKFSPTRYQRTTALVDFISSNKKTLPGTAKVEFEMEVVLTDNRGGPGFTKTYQLQAESPVSDMSTCEKYDKQGELSSQLMTEFFAQFQADLVAYLQKTK